MKKIAIILFALLMLLGCSKAEEETEEQVQTGDVVNIDFKGTFNGKEFEGGTSKDYDLRIGSYTFVDDFELQLVGMKLNETKTITVTFPDPYPNNPDLAGQEVQFEVTINEINR